MPSLTLEDVVRFSPFVARSLSAMHPGEDARACLAHFERIVEETFPREAMEAEAAAAADSQTLRMKLREMRRRLIVNIIGRNATGRIDYFEVVRLMSDFAETAVTATVKVNARELAERCGVPYGMSGRPQDLMVVGMGKLGGRELNVSSDIDLIFLFDEEGETRATPEFPNARRTLTVQEFYERLARRVIPALNDIEGPGFVFRVDMRLRPNGESGPIVCSTDMLEEYLYTQGRDWERFAWLKGRIINEPARKIGATTVDVIADLAGQQGVSMLDIISHADQYAKLSRAVMPLLKFWQIYQRLQDSLATRTLDEFASDVIELTGYKAMLEADAAKRHEDAADRLQNLGQLVNNVKNYCDQHGEEATLEGYLEDIALISDIDSYNESSDQVVLMTIHSAKGLEFPYVFLIGMEEGVFPSEMSKYSEADLEEERRLAYVGITRAKKELYISNSVTRMLYGRTQRNEPSRFLREIEPEYIEETRSPVLEQRSRMGGWGSEYSDTVPGGASGYSGPSGYSRSSYGGGYGSGYSSGNRSGYLNREYNAGEGRGFGSSYGGRSTSSTGFGNHYGNSSTQPTTRSGGFGSAYSGGNATKNTVKQTAFTVNSAVKPAASGSKHYEPGDIVEHKVFGRGTVLKVKPAAGDQIVEINFEKVGIKKTMANFAPLTKITEEE